MSSSASSSRSATNTYNNDDDTVASDGAVAVGKGASLQYNSGYQLGDGASMNVTAMDDNTAAVLSQSTIMSQNNAENAIEFAAGLAGLEKGYVTPVNTEVTALPNESLVGKKNLALAAGGVALLGGIILITQKGKNAK